jgi:hypothetical protein
MADDLTSDIQSFSEQWNSFCISILFSDFSLYKAASDFGKVEMPKLQALPGEMQDFVSRENQLIAKAEQTQSPSDLDAIVKDIQSFCDDRKPELQDCVTKLNSLRQQLTDGVSDVDSERAALQAEYDELEQEWNDAFEQCQGNQWIDPSTCAMAVLGADKYDELLEYGFTLSLLNFTVNCVDGLVADIVPLTAALDMLQDKVNEMLEDIDDGFADLPDIKLFLSKLH